MPSVACSARPSQKADSLFAPIIVQYQDSDSARSRDLARSAGSSDSARNRRPARMLSRSIRSVSMARNWSAVRSTGSSSAVISAK